MEEWMSPETEDCRWEREWTEEGIPILQAIVCLPRPIHREDRRARRIDRFYQAQGRAYLRYCEYFLLPRAAAEAKAALSDSRPLPCYQAELSYQITCAQQGIWSLHTDSREVCSGIIQRLRRGDTWDLRSGYPLPLSSFFPRRFPLRRTLLETAAKEIRRQEERGISRYREDWQLALRRSFSREHFYVTPEELCFFWQMYDIAPAAEGIPTFRIPFSEELCHLPPL